MRWPSVAAVCVAVLPMAAAWADLPVAQTPTFAKPVADLSKARVGRFTVQQIATLDPDRLMDEWWKTSPRQLTTDSGTRRNRPIETFFVIGGCAQDAKGDCHVTADIEIIAPNGSLYSRHPDVTLWNGPAPISPAEPILSAASLALRIEDGEPLGAYRIKAAVSDQHTWLVARTEQVLTVTEAPPR